MIRKATFKSRTFQRFMVSYISVAMAAYLLVATVLLLTAYGALEDQSSQAQRNRLSYVTEDLDSQINVFRSIALHVQTSRKFLPSYLQRGPLNELEVIHELNKYGGYSPLSFELYLYYPDSDAMYTMTAKTYLSVFAEHILNVEESMLRTKIMDTGQFMTMELWPERPGYMVFNFAVPLYNAEAHLLVFVRQADLVQRYADIYGIDPGEFGLLHNEHLLLGTMLQEKNAYSATLHQNEAFVVQISHVQIDMRILSSVYRGVQILFVIGAVIFATSVYLAYRSYRPVRALFTDIMPQHVDVRDEMEMIRQILRTFVQQSSASENQLHEMAIVMNEQRALIQEQILQRLLTDAPSHDYISVLDKINIHLADCGALALVRVEMMPTSPMTPSDFLAKAEGQSDENVRIYGTLVENMPYLIVAMTDEGDAIYLMDLILALRTDGNDFDAYLCGVTEDSDQLHALYEASHPDRAGAGQIVKMQEKDIEMLDALISAVRYETADKLQMICQQLTGRIHAAYPTELGRRGVLAEVNYRIWQLAKELEIDLGDDFLDGALADQSVEEYFIRLQRRLLEISVACQDPMSLEQNRAILSFISGSIGDYALTLRQTAEHFCLSEKRISTIVRELTGYSYKEYVIHLRMRRAAQLLRTEELSVSDVGQAVGYVNISYFIRSFKSIYGMTPATYKVYVRRGEAVITQQGHGKKDSDAR